MNIAINIHPIFKDEPVPSDIHIIATARTYPEIIEKYEQYIKTAVRKEKARLLK